MASARERNGRWTGLYRAQDGSQKSAGTFDSKKDALKAASAHEAVEALGRDAKKELAKPVILHRHETRHGVTVAGYFDGWLAGHKLRATSRETYACLGHKHILPALGNVALKDLDNARVRTFFRELESGRLSPASVGHVATVLKEMIRTAVADGLMDRDPTITLKLDSRTAREMKILTRPQYERLLAVVDPRYKTLIELLVQSGLRWGESQALRPGDLEDCGSHFVIKVRRSVAEVGGIPEERDYLKTSRSKRDVAVSHELGEALLAQVRNGVVFTAPRGGRLTRSNFRRRWLAALEAAGIEGVRVHDLRHTAASWMLAHGADLVAVRDALGHADVRTTSRYLHVTESDRPAVLDAMARAVGKAA